MKVYWDSTALINALASKAVLDRLSGEDHFTRVHTFVEVFHHITGRGIALKDGTRLSFGPEDGATAVRLLAKRLKSFELEKEQVLTALDDSRKRGVSGRMVHDWLHLQAAKLGGATVLLTRDEALHKLSKAEGLAADWP